MVFFFIEGDDVDFGEAAWFVWTFIADAGSHAETKGESMGNNSECDAWLMCVVRQASRCERHL